MKVTKIVYINATYSQGSLFDLTFHLLEAV